MTFPSYTGAALRKHLLYTSQLGPMRMGAIGEPQREIEIEPIEEPVGEPVHEPAAPEREPEKVPA